MRITRIEAIPLAIPLARVYRISQGADETGQFIITRVETDEGIVGYGEANPHQFFSADSVENVKSAIDCYLAPALEGANPFDIEPAVRIMDRAIKGNPYAKSA